MTDTALVLTDISNGLQFTFQPRHVYLGGYTGRDRAVVQHHIDELAAHGIPPPPRIPDLYPGRVDGLQLGGELPHGQGWSSGEVEYVLIAYQAITYVGIGSDHTDRVMERDAMIPAKQAFPKIIGTEVWPLDRLEGEWDSLQLRSWMDNGWGRRCYQSGSLSAILAPRDLLGLVPPAERADGLVLFSGTVPSVEAAPQHGSFRMEGELIRPSGQVLARCSYQYQAGPEPGASWA